MTGRIEEETVGRKKKRRRKRKGRRREDEEGSGGSAKKMTQELSDQLREWAREAAEANGLALFDVEPTVRGRWIIRVYVERLGENEPGEGVNVDQCAEVSRYMEAYLDADDRIPENYVLEVSSPGLERPLKRPEHLERAVGEQLELVARVQLDGRNKVVAELLSFEGGVLTLQLEDGDEPVELDWEDVARARLKYDF